MEMKLARKIEKLRREVVKARIEKSIKTVRDGYNAGLLSDDMLKLELLQIATKFNMSIFKVSQLFDRS